MSKSSISQYTETPIEVVMVGLAGPPLNPRSMSSQNVAPNIKTSMSSGLAFDPMPIESWPAPSPNGSSTPMLMAKFLISATPSAMSGTLSELSMSIRSPDTFRSTLPSPSLSTSAISIDRRPEKSHDRTVGTIEVAPSELMVATTDSTSTTTSAG